MSYKKDYLKIFEILLYLPNHYKEVLSQKKNIERINQDININFNRKVIKLSAVSLLIRQ